MLDLNKFSGKSKSEILHSSGYAQLGQGDSIGSAGGQTFQQRLEKSNAHSRTVKGYHHSKVGSQRGALRAKKFAPPSDGDKVNQRYRSRQAFNAGDDSGAAQRGDGALGSRQAFNAGDSPPKPSISFKEPPSRGYNPYA